MSAKPSPPNPVARPRAQRSQQVARHAADLRGAAQLASDATAGLTDLVEAMHERIARLPVLGRADAGGRTRGITGLVYRSIRGVTRVVGGSVNALLGLLAPALDSAAPLPAPRPEREAVIAALNGVLGDYLAGTHNPLATAMALRCDGQALVLNRDALNAQFPDARGALIVMVHGLCMNDLQWLRNGQDHGLALARSLGLTPLYLHYNSGQHISINGRELAALLEQLLAHWPHPVQRLVLLCHSMGGLVARSALAQAQAAQQRWTSKLSDLIFLGTPHQGAPLERAGHGVDLLLSATPYAAPMARLGKLRSAGITDLRHGYLRDEDWIGRDSFERGPDRRLPLPLPKGVRCFAVAASLGSDDADPKHSLLGDGLVPVDSALGRHAEPALTLAFPRSRQWVCHGINHLDLLSRPQVMTQLSRWLTRPA